MDMIKKNVILAQIIFSLLHSYEMFHITIRSSVHYRVVLISLNEDLTVTHSVHIRNYVGCSYIYVLNFVRFQGSNNFVRHASWDK